METAPDRVAQAPVDEHLHCLRCDYNLTGLSGERCPECGTAVDWPAVRQVRTMEEAQHGTCWERWRWYAKPAAFVVTALQAAFTPWILARQLPSRTVVLMPAIFLGLCIVGGMAPLPLVWDQDEFLLPWSIGVICHVLLSTLCFGLLLPPWRVRHRFRFWFAATCYTSYPLLVERFTGPPVLMPLHAKSNILPFSLLDGSMEVGSADLVEQLSVNAVYYLWLAGLTVIAWVRLPRRHRWRIILLILSVFVLTSISSHTGCQLADIIKDLG